MHTEFSVYFGQEQKNGYTGFLAEKNFFCVAEIFDGYTQEKGEQLMSTLAHVFEFDAPQSLSSFDTTISEVIKKANVPLDTSLAAGYVRDNILYLKTVGSGQVALRRGSAFETIVKGANIASGRVSSHDTYVFTTTFFSEVLKGFEHIKTLISKHAIDELPDKMKEHLGSQDDTGAIALFIRSNSVEQGEESARVPLSFSLGDIKKKGKFFLIPFLVVCVGLLAWNIFQTVTKKGVQLQGGVRVEELKQSIQSSLETAEGQKEQMQEGLQTLQKAQQSLQELKKIAQKKDQ